MMDSIWLCLKKTKPKLMLKKLFFGYFLIWGIALINAQQAYYKDVDLTASGLALKQALAVKIISTHTHTLRYTPGVWEASKATDLYPSIPNHVTLIYGWENGTDLDITNDQSRDKGFRDSGNNQLFVWNREHVFPKSLANPKLSTSQAGAGTDAHNLRPADKQRNAERSNAVFAPGSGTASKTVANGWYPGDQWKGDVARIIMYMYLRYGDQCLPTAVGFGSSSNTPDAMLDLFLQWNAEDPVSELEKTRNDYHQNTSNTYAQGNRNPFIDNPYLATRIWGGPAAQDIWGLYTALSVSTEKPVQFSVYPNPLRGNNLHLHQSKQGKLIKIEVYSMSSKLVRTIENPTRTIDLGVLPSGVYLLKIISTNAITHEKLIKNN